MPAAIDRTCNGEGVGLRLGDRHPVIGQRRNGHAQALVGDDFNVRALGLQPHAVRDEQAALGFGVGFDRHGMSSLVGDRWTTGTGGLLHPPAGRHFVPRFTVHTALAGSRRGGRRSTTHYQ